MAYILLVIVWGAFVRATGSGAGCGNNWPTCNGEVVPRAPAVETLIEYTHRITSGVALILVAVLVVAAFRVFPARHRVRIGAVVSLIFILIEAAIGAGLVLFELVGDNASIARAVYMAVHLANTFFLLSALAITAHWSGGAPAPASWRGNRLSAGFWASTGILLAIGVTGAVAALGDTLFPATSLTEGLRQDLSPTAHVLIQLRVLHPFIAFLGSLFLLSFVAKVRKLIPAAKGADGGPASVAAQARRYATLLNVLVLTQLALGSLNIVLMAPVWMQLVHLLMADLLWISLMLTGNTSMAVVAGRAETEVAIPGAAPRAAEA